MGRFDCLACWRVRVREGMAYGCDVHGPRPPAASPETEERCGRCGRVEDALCEHDLANDPHAGTGPYPVHRRQGVVSCLSGHPFVPETEERCGECGLPEKAWFHIPLTHEPEPGRHYFVRRHEPEFGIIRADQWHQCGPDCAIHTAVPESRPSQGTMTAADWEAAARFLFDRLDDIDTAGDSTHTSEEYRELVESIHRRRFEIASTDGYTVTFKPATSQGVEGETAEVMFGCGHRVKVRVVKGRPFDVPGPCPDCASPGVEGGTGGRRLVYLASPYSSSDLSVRDARFDAVCREAAVWMNEGVHIYSPIAHTHPIAVRGELPTDWRFWEAYDRVMIDAADEVWVLMLDGWQDSRGVTAEVKIAGEQGKVVRYIEPRAAAVPPPPDPEATPVCDCSDQKPCSHFPEPEAAEADLCETCGHAKHHHNPQGEFVPAFCSHCYPEDGHPFRAPSEAASVAPPETPEPEAAEAVLCETCGKPEDARCYRHGIPNLIHFSATDCYPHHPFRAPSEVAGGSSVNPGFCPSCLKPEPYCVCVVNKNAAAPPETPEPAEDAFYEWCGELASEDADRFGIFEAGWNAAADEARRLSEELTAARAEAEEMRAALETLDDMVDCECVLVTTSPADDMICELHRIIRRARQSPQEGK